MAKTPTKPKTNQDEEGAKTPEAAAQASATSSDQSTTQNTGADQAAPVQTVDVAVQRDADDFYARELANYNARMKAEDEAQVADSALVSGEITQAGLQIADENAEVSE